MNGTPSNVSDSVSTGSAGVIGETPNGFTGQQIVSGETVTQTVVKSGKTATDQI